MQSHNRRLAKQATPKWVPKCEPTAVVMMAGWSFGAACRSYYPPLGLPMDGYAITRYADAVLDELSMSAIVLGRDGVTVAMASVDAVAISNSSSRRIRRLVTRATGIPAEHIMLFASHTHTGPVTRMLVDRSVDAAWQSVFEAQFASIVIEAASQFAPGNLQVGLGREMTLMFNRRTVDSTGRAEMSLDQSASPNDLRTEGPIDTSVGVIRLDDEHGEPKALFVNYANHPDLPTGTAYSADYPGVMRRIVQRALGPGVAVVFGNGAAANIEHLDPLRPATWSTRKRYHDAEGVQRMHELGKAVGIEVIKTVQRCSRTSRTSAIDVVSSTLAVPIRVVEPERVAVAKALLDDPGTTDRDRLFAQDVVYVHGRAGDVEDFEIHLIAFGDVAIVGLPVEVFAETGLAIKAGSPFPYTFVVELANGWLGYLPTEEAHAAGGYETSERACRLTTSAEPMVRSTVLALLHASWEASPARNDSHATHS